MKNRYSKIFQERYLLSNVFDKTIFRYLKRTLQGDLSSTISPITTCQVLPALKSHSIMGLNIIINKADETLNNEFLVN